MSNLKVRKWDKDGKPIFWATDKYMKEWEEFCKYFDDKATKMIYTEIKK